MSNIVTVSREFGSGGREVGKRWSDCLGYAYYDREILTGIAEKIDLDEQYVENSEWLYFSCDTITLWQKFVRIFSYHTKNG